MDRLWTVAETAAFLRVHPQSVRRWLRAGVLAGAAIGRGGAYRIEHASIERFLDDRRGRPTLRRRGEDTRRSPVAHRIERDHE